MLVLFDGVCNLCNTAVLFIIKRDPKGLFQFAALQSAAGQEALSKANRTNNQSIDTIVLIVGDRYYERSSAALHIARHLKGGWPLLYAFIIVPKPVRDWVYRIIANNRYRWFGQKQSCMIPTPELRHRFLS